ncbi:MAG: GNAT family N-acetyltransferase [Armatimonadota bacterium]|nr:GNAT family N-acetyltransferase [Armatimonadota bacterium]MDR5696506.1 GNAT family N-acetyltransferase [Armatimonadota bacterium]
MRRTRMRIEIRPFEESDYPALAEMRNENHPTDPVTADTLRFWWEAAAAAGVHRERYVATDPDSGDPIGSAWFGHNAEMFHPDKYDCQVIVRPAFGGRGVGSQLWEVLHARLRERAAILARARVWEAHPHAVAFARRRGFRERRRTWQSILDVRGVDLAAHAHRWDRLRTRGIWITTLAQERTQDPDCLRKLHRLHDLALRNMPLPDEPTGVPWESFLRWVTGEKAIPEATFIAKDGDRYVGCSHLERDDEPGTLGQGLTATDPDCTGRGIAWALKLCTVRYAQEHGYQRIKTWNDSANHAMLSINLRLGFVPQPAWITMEAPLGPQRG